METGRSKRPFDGAEDETERRTRARGPEDERTATDDEVEEFFAILRRISDATRWFAARNGSGGAGGGGGHNARPAAESVLWRRRPAFQWEDFMEAGAAKDDGRWAVKGEDAAATGGDRWRLEGPPGEEGQERVAENASTGSLDLNAEPEPEGPASPSPLRDSAESVGI